MNSVNSAAAIPGGSATTIGLPNHNNNNNPSVNESGSLNGYSTAKYNSPRGNNNNNNNNKGKFKTKKDYQRKNIIVLNVCFFLLTLLLITESVNDSMRNTDDLMI